MKKSKAQNFTHFSLCSAILLHAGLVLVLLLGLFLLDFSQVFATSQPPLEPGCYTEERVEALTVYSEAVCPGEGFVDELVNEYGACFVGTAERDCDNPSQPGSNVPSNSPPVDDQNGTIPSNGNNQDIGSSGEGVFDTGDKSCDDPSGELNSENCAVIYYIVLGINVLSAVAGLAIVASLMIAGFQYMTAQDNSGKIQQAKTRIYWTITALVLFVFMYALLNFLIPGGVL